MWIFLDDKRKDPTIVHNEHRGLGPAIGKSNNWIIVRDYDSFVEIVHPNFDLIDLISFDHDISSYDKNTSKELTGKDAAQFVIEYCMDRKKTLPDWFVHSDNNRGNENIRKLLINYMFRVENRINEMNDSFGYINGEFIYHR